MSTDIVEQLRARGLRALTDTKRHGVRELSVVAEKSRVQHGDLEGFGRDLLLRIDGESVSIYLSIIRGTGLGPLWSGRSPESAIDRLESAFAVLDNWPEDVPFHKMHESLRQLLDYVDECLTTSTKSSSIESRGIESERVHMAASTESGFHIAAFAIDGELIDAAYLEMSRLSSQWLTVCAAFLDAHGGVFNAAWPGALAHLRTKFTSAEGAALATFFVNDEIALMAMLASGRNPGADAELTAMFVRSLQDLTTVQAAAATPQPFTQMTTLVERPLLVAVPWPLETISDSDMDLVRELSWHLAGAYFSASKD